MAWGKRIYCQFTQDITDVLVDVEIQQDGFNPANAVEVVLGEPGLITRMGGEGDKYTVIKGREVTINVLTRSTDDFSWLYTNNDREFRVIIKYATVIEWTGFVLTGQYQEMYSYEGDISITASDQLGLLGEQLYQFGSPAASPSGYEKMIIVLANILSATSKTKTGLDLIIYCQMNLFEVTMNITDDDDPLDQAYVNQDLWINSDLSASNCLKVITDILTPFQCRILQSNGVWWIQRVPDMADTSIDYRIFNREGVPTGYSHLHPQVVIDANFIILDGAYFKFDSAWKDRNIEIDYGFKTSLIPSYNLPDSAFTSSVPAAISGWTNTGEWYREHDVILGNLLAADTDGRTSLDYGAYIKPASVQVRSTDELTLSIDGGIRVFGFSTSKNYKCSISIYFIRNIGDPTPMGYDDEAQTWADITVGPPYFPIIKGFDFPRVNSISNLVTQSITITNIPADGTLTITIYAPTKGLLVISEGRCYIKNIQLTGDVSEDSDLYLKTLSINAAISSDSNFKPADLAVRVVDSFYDNTVIQYYDGVIKIGTAICGYWEKKGLTGTSMQIVPSSLTPTKSCITDSWWWQYSTTNKIFEGIFRGTLRYHQTLVIDGTVYLQNDIECDVRDNIVTGSLIEIKAETPSAGTPVLSLISTGEPPVRVSSSGSMILPGGSDNELQIKVGGDFDGTTGITFDGTRILKGGTLPLIDYHSNTQSISAGAQTISFPEPYIAGDSYSIVCCYYYDGEGSRIELRPTNKTITGFDIAPESDGTLTYTTIINR